RRLDHRHVAQSQERHVQGARNGRGAHSEHVHVVPKLLEPLFVADAEALFFVDDEQAKIVKDHVVREQAMRADEYVDSAGSEIFENGFHFFWRAKTADQLDTYREGRE